MIIIRKLKHLKNLKKITQELEIEQIAKKLILEIQEISDNSRT